MAKFATSGAHPPLGTLIDNDSLELVELVGSGGYGVVYRAVETIAKPGRKRRTFAVKVLNRNDGRRNTHIREASLHYHVSGHPNVIDLYQVLEDDKYMYFVMQYARSKDLFHQILNESYYLGNDQGTKNVFLQLLDAVDHLHKMGVYHRDLKPENVLCLEDGYHIAISDFGLATTDTSSVEFRTGSVYHMSPECQSGRFAEDAYSPMSNDVWSLGIILLNMVTGRNPWKSATMNDPVFQSYCRSPFNFFCSVLPVSAAFNKVLIQVLDPNWKTRMSLPRFRKEVEKIKTFYSSKVVFEGSLARCPWEVDPHNVRKMPEMKQPMKRRPVPPPPAGVKAFPAKDREAPPTTPIPEKVEKCENPPPSSPCGTPPPPARVIKPPRRCPVPPMPSDTTPCVKTVDTECNSSMEAVPLGDANSFVASTTLDDGHSSPYSSQASGSSTYSFPKTPENGGFMRRKNKIDVKIMASTHASPSPSLLGDIYSPQSKDDLSSYLDLSFSNDLLETAPDEAMLSPAPSQYSLHEASDYSMWTDVDDLIQHKKEYLGDNSDGDGDFYPDLRTPAPSKPIDIVCARQRQPSRMNMFDNPYHQLHSNSKQYRSRSSLRIQPGYHPQMSGLMKLWSRGKSPARPTHPYTGRTYCNTHAHKNHLGGHWFDGKVLAG